MSSLSLRSFQPDCRHYDVIQRLRPNMLRGRGPNEQVTGASPAEAGTAGRTINVYLDGKWLGDPSRLQSVQSSTV